MIRLIQMDKQIFQMMIYHFKNRGTNDEKRSLVNAIGQEGQ